MGIIKMKFSHPYKKKLIAAFLAGCFFIASCENSEKQILELTSKRIGVEHAKGITINYSIGAKAKAQLTAPVMLRYQDTIPYIEFPQSIHADFFDDSLQVESKLDAHYARYMETESKVYLKDSVRLYNRNGDTLYTSELFWDRSKIGKEFYTDKPFRIRGKTQLLNGTGLESSQDFKERLYKNITNSVVRVPASQFPQ